MSNALATSRTVKERLCWAAYELLTRGGCTVQKTTDGPSRVILTIDIPADPDDIHGERLKALLAEVT